MTNPTRGFLRAASLAAATVLLLQGCEGCAPSTTRMKSTELTPSPGVRTGMTGFAGSVGGICLEPGDVPLPARKQGPGQAQVGFDNFYRAGGTLSCDDLRATIFRANVPFDLSQFDEVYIAQLKFDSEGSFRRDGVGDFLGQSPPASYATTLGMATMAPTSALPFDSDVSLPAQTNISVTVTDQVREWVQNGRQNFGFVIAGPVMSVDKDNPPKNNNARLSVYGNFRLVISYVPEKNPRAPQ